MATAQLRRSAEYPRYFRSSEEVDGVADRGGGVGGGGDDEEN